MKLPIKRIATSALALLLTVAMLMSIIVTAGAIEFSGIPGGGGAQQNSNGTAKINMYSVRATTHFYEHLIGYRFSVVTGNGELKSGTTVKDIYLEEALLNIDNCLRVDDYFFYEAAVRTATKLPKSEIRQTYTTEYADLTRNTVGPGNNDVLDSLLGLSDSLPLSPYGIEEWCRYKEGQRLNALLVGAGVTDSDGLSILDSTDRILVEPIFEMKLGGEYFALTVTEIGVYEYHAYKDKALNEYGQTYASDGFLYCKSPNFGDAYADAIDQGVIIESALGMLNYRYPDMLVENGAGIPEGAGAGEFWETTEGCSKHTVPNVSKPIIPIADLIERGFGVAVVWAPEEPEPISLVYNVNGTNPIPSVNSAYGINGTGFITQSGSLVETIVPSNSSAEPTNWEDMGLKRDGYTLNSSPSWNTNPNGRGTSFNPSSSYSYSQYKTALDAQMKDEEVDRTGVDEGTLVLYAIWNKQLIIKYHTNGGMVGSNTMTAEPDYIIKSSNGVDVITTVSEGNTATLADWTDWKLTRDGYTLDTSEMWNGSASGMGTVFGTTATYDALYALDTDKDGVVILYAVWEKKDTGEESEETEPEKPDKIYLRYHTNGGTVSKDDLIEENGYVKYHTGGGNYAFFDTIVRKGFSNEPRGYSNWGLAKEGYILNEGLMWNTKKDGNLNDVLVPGAEYSYSALVELDTDGDGVVILYAMWDKEEPETPETETPKQLIVKYHTNGGTLEYGIYSEGSDYIVEAYGVDVTTAVAEGNTATLVDWTNWKLTRDGYTLNEGDMWNTRADGNGDVLVLGTQHSYSDLAGFADENGVVILYAMWDKEEPEDPETETPKQLIIKYHANGGKPGHSDWQTGMDGIIETTDDDEDVITTVSEGNTTFLKLWTNWKLSKEGYTLDTSLMWNTKEDGEGEALSPGLQYSYSYDALAKLDTDGDGVVILYARWKEEESEETESESITVVYSPNNGSVGNRYAINGGVIYEDGERVETVFQKNGQTAYLCDWDDFGLTRSGYELWTYDMWNSSAEGDGEDLHFANPCSYDELIGFDTDKDGVVILYAAWQKQASDADLAKVNYTINFYVDGEKAGLPFNGAIIIDEPNPYSGRIKRTDVRKGESSYSSNRSSGSEIHLELEVYQKMSPDGAEFILFDENITVPLGVSAIYTRKAYFYSINYYSNSPDGSSIVVPDVHHKIPDHDATISPLVPFCSGWEFVEWNTKADGSGVGYAPEDVYGIDERLDLYAIWKSSPIRITISCYIDNRPANFMDGSVVLSRQDGATVEDIVFPTDKSSYTVSGVDGCKYVISAYVPQSDKPYYPIAEASASNPLVAKAVEGEPVVYEYSIYYYTITYKENLPAESSASVVKMPVPNPQYVLRGEKANISDNSPYVTDSKHTFVCWRTTADKTGDKYRPNQTVILVDSPLVLYAQWLNAPADHYADLVVYTHVDNERISIRDLGFDVRAEQVVVVDGEEYVVSRSLDDVSEGWYYVSLLSFGSYEWTYRVITTDENGVDWYLKEDGTYTQDISNGSFSIPETTRVVHEIHYYTITYLPNSPAEGDVGNMPEKQYALKGIEENLSSLIPTREDEYGFVNWNTHGDGTGTAYAKGAKVTLTDRRLILYAQWKTVMCELVFEAIIQGATTTQFVNDLPDAIWVETEEESHPLGKNGTVTVSLPKGTKYRLRAIYEDGGTVYPYTAKGNYEDTEFTLTKPFTHHGIYYYAINYFYGNTALETPARHYKLHGIDTLVSSDEPDYNFGTRFRFLNTWDQPDAEIKYEPGAVYNLDQKGDLYALVGMRVAYNANGGSVGEDYGLRSDGLITNNGVPVNILLTDDPPFPPIHYASSFSLSIPYYEFGGWNSEKDGTGVEYKEGGHGGPADFFKCETVDNGEYTVLYADWTPLVNTVSFEARPEEYGAVRFGSREIVAVSGIPRGSTMKIRTGSSVINIVVARDCTITRHYADGTQEDASYLAGRSVIIRPDPEDDTAEYSYSFVGWEGIIETITQDATVVALFDREGVSEPTEPTEPTPSNNTDIAIVPTKVNGDVTLGNQFSLSATVINNSDIDITPEMGIDAVVEIRRSGDTEATAVYRIENICVPKRGTNNATTDSIFLTTTGTHTQYTLFDNTNLIYTSAVIDASKRHGVYKATWTLDFSNANGFADSDSSNDSGYAGFRVRVVAEESNPSRPVYQTDIPSSFENKGPQEESTSNSFSWAYYEYNPSNPSKFIKREMSDKLQITLILTPENEGGLKEKEVLMAGVPDFITRAGYGFSLHRSYTGIDSGANASSVSAGRECVGTLTALMSYPEFNYSEDAGMYSKLLVSEAKPTGDSNSYFLSLPEYPDYQSNDINDRYAHYIPMWYPDGDYQPVSKFSGLWCPIGELEATVVQGDGRVVNGLTGKVDAEDSQEEMERMGMWTNKYTIQGSMYDDIYITH